MIQRKFAATDRINLGPRTGVCCLPDSKLFVIFTPKEATPHYKSMAVFFRCSRADNSLVGGPIWPKFELVQNNIHVLVTYKFKFGSDQQQSRKRGDIDFFKCSRAANSVISPQIWPNFELICFYACPHYLQV